MKTINKIILSLLVIMTFSCEDILEKDITDDVVQIISPTEGATITKNIVAFQWNTLKGATKYRVQVYNSNQSIVLDSLVSQNSLNFELPSDQYKWKVRGENFGYQSTYSESVSFSTAISNILTGQQVILTIPADDTYTNATTLSLNWKAIPVATGYDVKVITQGGVKILESNDLPAATTSLDLNSGNLTQETKYLWSVIAKNSTNSTQTDVVTRSFSVDKTPPNPPTGIVDKTVSVNLTTDFSWISPTDTGTIQSPISYIFQYASNINFDTSSIIFSSPPSTAIKYSKEFTNKGDFFWRVKAIDKAMNESYSTIAKLTVN
jgi:hypothetical protein